MDRRQLKIIENIQSTGFKINWWWLIKGKLVIEDYQES